MQMEMMPEGTVERPEDLDDTRTDDALLSDEIAAAEAARPDRPRRRPRRRPLPSTLPRVVIRHTVPDDARACAGCGDPMVPIGEDTSEILRLIPARFEVEEHRREKLACGRCKSGVVTAPGPAKFIERGRAHPSLLAHVVQSKYEDHLPLARLQHIYARGGVPLARSTLCDWTARVAEELAPIAERIWTRALETHVLQSDATGLRVLDRDDPNGIRRGTMWCVVGDATYVGFRFAPTGSGTDGPWMFLGGREGYLQADAATVFDRLFDGQAADAIEVGCWAHARRRFEAMRDTDSRVAYPLKLIAQLYRVEHLADARGLDPPGRLALRRERSRQILGRLTRWIARTVEKEPPESVMHKACAYIVNQHQALLRFLEDAEISLDNNLCERQLRALAIGRKNYLFAGSDRAAERAAILYTVIRTAALAKIDVYAYLVRILTRIAEGWPAARLDELLPENHVPEYDVVTAS
jgi:transposase